MAANTRRKIAEKSSPETIATKEGIDGYREKAMRIASVEQFKIGRSQSNFIEVFLEVVLVMYPVRGTQYTSMVSLQDLSAVQSIRSGNPRLKSGGMVRNHTV